MQEIPHWPILVHKATLETGKSAKAHLELNSGTVNLISGHSLCLISAIVSHDCNIIGYSAEQIATSAFSF